MNKEINILGGGISGLTCAIILLKNGYNVNIYEKRKATGTRFNSDWQGIENWSEETDVLSELRSFGIDLSFDYVPVCELNLHYSDKIRTLRGDKACYLVKRGTAIDCLDTCLLEQAKELGVNIYCGTKPDNNKQIHVIATGPEKGNILAKGIKFNTKRPDSYHMAFGDDIAKGFYSYLLIKNGEATIATVFDNRNVRDSENYLQNTIGYFSEYFDPEEVEAGNKFGGYGYFEIRKTLYNDDGAMLIGEAGGLQDYLWGFGMRYAFQSANFAARSIMTGESYDKLIKENLHKKLKHSKRNRKLFEILGPLAYPLAYRLFKKSKDPLKLLNVVYR
ncbi:NAD(P)/FAD-dependent oxidoreductase [Methanolobus bombayensis]|uniref:NAD(P)/FAD-dependent oxidoreductase n=1 Tax=Methanolobus bombayensis TaxID=38023 RepID=UPI001AE17313|nr:NAD(P)/FAD-dependent oxidoreductase [Methanolobus bombayensis]MBP1910129.1 flavin-dependent dehydrogenase [Methanolobus bombayensis]